MDHHTRPDLTLLYVERYPALMGLDRHARSVLATMAPDSVGRVRVALAAASRCDPFAALVAADRLARRRHRELDPVRTTFDPYSGQDGISGWLVNACWMQPPTHSVPSSHQLCRKDRP